LQTLYERFRPQGLVILAISDEEAAGVRPFIEERKYTYPVLVDPGAQVHKLFMVESIPKSFVFSREGKLVAEAMDRARRRSFWPCSGGQASSKHLTRARSGRGALKLKTCDSGLSPTSIITAPAGSSILDTNQRIYDASEKYRLIG